MVTPLGERWQRCSLPITAPSWGGNTNEKNRLWPRAQLGVPGGAGLGMIPIPSFPPPPSPAALDHRDSRGYDRAAARAKCLLGILAPWISLPRAWIQQGLENEVGMCGSRGWGAPGTASLAKVTTFLGDSLKTEIGSISPKTWCTDTCLNAHCLDHGGLFPGTLEGRHVSTVFTSCGWWRAKIFPIRDSQLARPDGGTLQKPGAPGRSGKLGPGNNISCLRCLFEFFLL